MNLFDFFFSEPAQASHLRSISNTMKQQSQRQTRATKTQAQINDSLSQTNADLAFNNLVLMSLIKSLMTKGLITKEDLMGAMNDLDGLDGKMDGQLDPNTMRGAMGMPHGEEIVENREAELCQKYNLSEAQRRKLNLK